MPESANDLPGMDSEESEATPPAERHNAPTSVLAAEAIIPPIQSGDTTALSDITLSRESRERTRRLREVSATLKFIGFGILLTSLAILVGVVYLIKDILALFVVSFLIAYVLSPIVDGIERKGVNRTLIVILMTLIVLGGVAVISTAAVSSIAGQVVKISEDIQNPEKRDQLVDAIAKTLNRVPEFIRVPTLTYLQQHEQAIEAAKETAGIDMIAEALEEDGGIAIMIPDTAPEQQTAPTESEPIRTVSRERVLGWVTLVQDEILGYIVGRSQQLLGAVGSSAKGAFSMFTASIIVLFMTFFILNGGPQMKKAFMQVVPNRFFEPTLVLVEDLDQQLGDYLRSRVLETIALSVLFVVGYWFLGLRFAIVLGIIGGLANLIPYIGPFIGAIPAFIAVFLGSRFGIGWSLLAVLGLTLLVQVVDNAIIFPLVIGKSVELGPVMTIIVVLLGEQLLGLIGLLMAVPIAAMIKLICQECYTQFKGYARSILHGN